VARKQITIVAGAVAALAAVGTGAAIAANDLLSPGERSQAVIDDAAKQLGIEPSELSNALEEALENQIDTAVAAGRLTQEQGDALKERIDSAGAPLVFGGFERGFGPGHLDLGFFGHLGDLGAAASYLGITRDELRDALADGKSLAEIAKDEGKSVDGLVQALVADAEERIDAAADDGRLTDAQANELKDDLQDRITELVNREPGWRSGFRMHRFGPEFGGPEGFHRFDGPRA
jgi:uncharacterized protein YidB (DUF937 family)